MKKLYYTLLVLSLSASVSFGQDTESTFAKDYEPIQNSLEEWDPIRGPWLASSLDAMSKNEPIPDRTFPEDLTPAQMIELLPASTRSEVAQIAASNTTGTVEDQDRWNKIRTVVGRPTPTMPDNRDGCGRRTARSYGDPHIQSFDGARYSFQTVGEFVLAKSSSGMEVQARQSASGDDFSLNTAVAMNVGGDRVGIYAKDHPDGMSTSPVRVNGRDVQVSSTKAYFLPNGGTISRTGNQYLISWPSGEAVTATMRGSGRSAFINVVVSVSKCAPVFYDGLLGNANGIERDDFQGMNDRADLRIPAGGGIFGSSREIEQQRLAFLANTMADKYRVSNLTTLFEYGIGQSTLTFTDRSFPSVHRTLDELSQRDRDAARRRCEQQGVTGRDLNACIFDNAHLGLPPTPPTVVPDPTEGVVLRPIKEPIVNTNPRPTGSGDVEKPRGRLTPAPIEDNNSGTRQTPVDNTDGNLNERKETTAPQVEEKPAKRTIFGTSSNNETKAPTTTRPPKVSTPKPAPKPSRTTTPKPKPAAPKPSAPKPSAPKSTRIGG